MAGAPKSSARIIPGKGAEGDDCGLGTVEMVSRRSSFVGGFSQPELRSWSLDRRVKVFELLEKLGEGLDARAVVRVGVSTIRLRGAGTVDALAEQLRALGLQAIPRARRQRVVETPKQHL